MTSHGTPPSGTTTVGERRVCVRGDDALVPRTIYELLEIESSRVWVDNVESPGHIDRYDLSDWLSWEIDP